MQKDPVFPNIPLPYIIFHQWNQLEFRLLQPQFLLSSIVQDQDDMPLPHKA